MARKRDTSFGEIVGEFRAAKKNIVTLKPQIAAKKMEVAMVQGERLAAQNAPGVKRKPRRAKANKGYR